MIDHDRNNLSNANKNSSISINIEDLMVFEEKFSEIIYFLKNGKEARNQCFDFWNYFFNCSLYERIEKIFKTDKNIEIAKLSINLELITVMICYEFSFDIGVLNKSNLLLLEILELSHRNLIIICENILMKIIPENQKNIWALKLNNLVNNSKKFISNNISNLSHIEQIIMNSTKLSQKLQNIFSIFGTEYSPLIYSLYKKIHQKSYSEINDFFIEYILKIENKESSILAPVLLSSNPNFISFRPPYIHTERIKPYTLILDLNDTIVNFQQTNNSQGILRLRPFLIEFLEEISHYYELILFTTSTEYFSKPIINAIEENKKYFDFVFYREYAIIVGNDFVKDLTRIGRSLDSTIIIDNMPQNFRLQKENGIHIKPFFAQDPNDNTLIELMNILIIIAKSGVDVREELAKYRNDIVQKVTSNISKYNN
jgi:Dullard-like phosphatase family protein